MRYIVARVREACYGTVYLVLQQFQFSVIRRKSQNVEFRVVLHFLLYAFFFKSSRFLQRIYIAFMIRVRGLCMQSRFVFPQRNLEWKIL